MYDPVTGDPQVGTLDYCDQCGQPHEATYSHEAQFGQGPIFAVVCPVDDLTDYYTLERVTLPAPVERVDERGSVTEHVVCGVLLAMSAVVFLFIVLVWWAPRADATRVVPGSGWEQVDKCDNKRGVQTVLDITTGHRFRVVHVTPDGRNICRKVARR